MDAIVLKEFITEKEQSELVLWIEKEFEYGNIPLLPSAKKCYHNCYCKMDVQGIAVFNEIKDRVVERFKLDQTKVAYPLGHFTMVMKDGASLGQHQDSSQGTDRHFRCNLLIKKPKFGKVYIKGNSYETEERDLCCFFPNESLHWSDVISGDRFTCSFGFFVSKDWKLQ